jgi:hypothetical protein
MRDEQVDAICGALREVLAEEAGGSHARRSAVA